MSIIVKRKGDNKIYNFMKGADIIIFDKLTKESNKNSSIEQKHVQEFAAAGLRTLVFGMKEMTTSCPEKDKLKETPCGELDNQIDLLGVTGL